jgi:hypothetical protein
LLNDGLIDMLGVILGVRVIEILGVGDKGVQDVLLAKNPDPAEVFQKSVPLE